MDRLNELLLTVQRPGRYTGGEWNSTKKEWTDNKVKVLLAFPDVYEIGMSYLGTKILYGILNGRDDCLCERAFSPWKDFEGILRKEKISLFSLESRVPIKEFDMIGFSFASELTFTNALNILDLGGIPLVSSERGDDDPLIIAGGPSCYNPEPMAEFIDAFVIGDGEEIIGEIVDAYKNAKSRPLRHCEEDRVGVNSDEAILRSGIASSLTVFAPRNDKERLLRELAKIKGIYVPSLYKAPVKIEKRVVEDLDAAFYPTRQIVPNIGIVHDRIAIEIMRGCKHFCKFCQAAITYRPCRERSKEKILELAKEAYAMTGYDEISLLSLSSVDHSRLKEIIEELNGIFSDRSVSISVPSLRIEEMLKDLPVLISKVRKTGLTFAPEAGSEALRRSINKNIDIEKLSTAVLGSFKSGWRRLKLYFMIGLPNETEEDILGIAELIYKISNLKKEVDGRPANVAASINAFVPKPHTPLQRLGMDPIERLEAKKELLKRAVRSKMIELNFHPFRMSFIEAALSRGDRRLGEVIYEAWRSGAKFDGWNDMFNFDIWESAFRKRGIDPAYYVNRPIHQSEGLPWGFISLGHRPRDVAD